MNHLLALLSSKVATIFGGFVLGLACKYLPRLLESELEHGIESLKSNAKTPAQKELIHAILAVVDEQYPNVGDAKYSMAIDSVIKAIPPLEVVRQPLVDLLSDLGKAGKDALDKESQP